MKSGRKIRITPTEIAVLALMLVAFAGLLGAHFLAGVPERRDDVEVIPAGAAVGVLADGTVDLNAADKAALMTLPGVGDRRAQAILDYRDAHGPFTAPDDLLRVPGISLSVLDPIRDKICIRDSSPS